jgi:hypothetical protein
MAKLCQRRFATFDYKLEIRAQKSHGCLTNVRTAVFIFFKNIRPAESVLDFTSKSAVRKFFARLILGTPFIVLQYYKPSFSLYNYKRRIMIN